MLNNCVCFPYKVPPSPFTAAKAAPTMELSFEMVQAEDCDPTPRTPEETSELFSRLADALIKQIEVHCTILLSSTLLSWFMFCIVELFSPRKRYIYVVQVIKHGWRSFSCFEICCLLADILRVIFHFTDVCKKCSALPKTRWYKQH